MLQVFELYLVWAGHYKSQIIFTIFSACATFPLCRVTRPASFYPGWQNRSVKDLLTAHFDYVSAFAARLSWSMLFAIQKGGDMASERQLLEDKDNFEERSCLSLLFRDSLTWSKLY